MIENKLAATVYLTVVSRLCETISYLPQYIPAKHFLFIYYINCKIKSAILSTASFPVLNGDI